MPTKKKNDYLCRKINCMEQIKDLLCNERVMLYAIMVNTALMFVGGFWPASPWFEWTDAFFTLLFLFEPTKR